MKGRMLDWLRDEEGQGMVEYALIISLVAVALVGALFLLGSNLLDKYGGISNQIP